VGQGEQRGVDGARCCAPIGLEHLDGNVDAAAGAWGSKGLGDDGLLRGGAHEARELLGAAVRGAAARAGRAAAARARKGGDCVVAAHRALGRESRSRASIRGLVRPKDGGEDLFFFRGGCGRERGSVGGGASVASFRPRFSLFLRLLVPLSRARPPNES
jgi:hypothetical protein